MKYEIFRKVNNFPWEFQNRSCLRSGCIRLSDFSVFATYCLVVVYWRIDSLCKNHYFLWAPVASTLGPAVPESRGIDCLRIEICERLAATCQQNGESSESGAGVSDPPSAVHVLRVTVRCGAAHLAVGTYVNESMRVRMEA
eukprot:1195633-Prorocentrum_minimum.AAC.8